MKCGMRLERDYKSLKSFMAGGIGKSVCVEVKNFTLKAGYVTYMWVGEAMQQLLLFTLHWRTLLHEVKKICWGSLSKRLMN